MSLTRIQPHMASPGPSLGIRRSKRSRSRSVCVLMVLMQRMRMWWNLGVFFPEAEQNGGDQGCAWPAAGGGGGQVRRAPGSQRLPCEGSREAAWPTESHSQIPLPIWEGTLSHSPLISGDILETSPSPFTNNRGCILAPEQRQASPTSCDSHSGN